MAQVINLLKDLQARLGLAYLFITHNLAVVEYLAHQIAVMYLGRIVEEGTVEEVLETPKHPTDGIISAGTPAPAGTPPGLRPYARVRARGKAATHGARGLAARLLREHEVVLPPIAPPEAECF